MLQFRLKRDHPSLLINGKIAMLGKLIEILLDLLLIIQFKEKVAALESISVKNPMSITHAKPDLCRRFPDFEDTGSHVTGVLPGKPTSNPGTNQDRKNVLLGKSV